MVRATLEFTFIWELPGWPRLSWDAERLAPSLDSARRARSGLLGTTHAAGGLPAEAAATGMAREVVDSSAIKG